MPTLARGPAALVLLALAAGCGGAETGAGAPPPGRPGKPKLPYATFDGTTFEPSAVAYDPATDHFIVLSDKDAIVYRYKLTNGRLERPKAEHHRAIHHGGKDFALKFEAIARLDDGAFIATTAFDRAELDFRHVIRFRFALEGEIDAEVLSFPEAEMSALLKTADPALAYWKIEGLAATPGDRAALFAIRSVGKSHKDKRDVCWIVRCPMNGKGFGPPDRLLRYDLRAAVGREEGASSLERDPVGAAGGYFLLTSYEDEAREDYPGAHGGHLFHLPAADLEGDGPTAAAALGAPLKTLLAKPEGLAVFKDGLLIVFDDDQPWKRTFEGYEQSQGAFLHVPPKELAGWPGAGAPLPPK